MALSSTIKRGILALPGADAASKAMVEKLLYKNYTDHHCFFRRLALHNHLSHHVLAAYDLGASASLIQAIFNDEAKIQIPIDLRENGIVPPDVVKPGEIAEDNWTKWLGDPKAYSAYVSFFSNQIATNDIARTLENYVFSPAANGNDSNMLFRLVSGAFHPFIQVGYGLEFDSKVEVAAGLAQAAVHKFSRDAYISPGEFVDITSPSDISSETRGRQPRKGPSVLSLLRQIYDSPKLTPILPYDPDALLSKRTADLLGLDGGSRIAELKRIISRFDPGDSQEDMDSCVEELIFASTLLAFATGKKNRKPRVDFFLMHCLTSSLFVPSFFKYVQKTENKRALIRTYLQPWGIIIMTRGRPRIDPALLMSYTDHPTPPNSKRTAHPSSIDGNNVESVNPWPLIIADAIHSSDSHVVKALRTLVYGAVHFGTVPKGGMIGAFGADGKETHPGIAETDGTIFVRAAGILMNSLGWSTHGEETRDWDRSALGWDDAWKGGD